MNNWQAIGLKSPQEGMKYALHALYKNRKNILDVGLGGEWKQGDNKHPAIPELRELPLYIFDGMTYLNDKGFSSQSKVRVSGS